MKIPLPSDRVPKYNIGLSGHVYMDTAVYDRDIQALCGALNAVVAADERGQGLPFKEAMDHAHALLKSWGY